MLTEISSLTYVLAAGKHSRRLPERRTAGRVWGNVYQKTHIRPWSQRPYTPGGMTAGRDELMRLLGSDRELMWRGKGVSLPRHATQTSQ